MGGFEESGARVIFQPTRPLRGATDYPLQTIPAESISTHAPLAGRDDSFLRRPRGRNLISTHAPLAGRDPCQRRETMPLQRRFQPTRPLRGATQRPDPQAGNDISTHAPLAGRDDARMVGLDRRVGFQPTRPLRGATFRLGREERHHMIFQPTRPLRGATLTADLARAVERISTHAPLAGRDILIPTGTIIKWDFNPRAPCGARPPRPPCWP